MSRLAAMTRYLVLDFTRHRLMVFIIVALPVLLLLMAVQSAPSQATPLRLSRQDLLVDSQEVSVVSFAMTAVVLVTALTGFFTGFQIKQVLPRLRLMGYSGVQIQGGLVLLLVAINAYATAFIGGVSLVWLETRHLAGYFATLFAGGVVFAVLGLIVARLVNTRSLGLNVILVIAVLDTAFLENPVFSRRFQEAWLDIMPAHRPVRLLYESVFLDRPDWLGHGLAMAAYLAMAIAVLLALGRLRGVGA